MRVVLTYVLSIAIQAGFAQYTLLMRFSKRSSFAKASKGRRIYLDYASAPPVLPEAVVAMRAGEAQTGNPGAIHTEGVTAKKSLEDSRARIAALLGCKARELLFTSGLTESNNLAILGYARKLEFLGTLGNTYWIVSSIEHDSVLEAFSEVERMGGSVSYVEPDERGIILPGSIERALRPETVFVSVGWANNEIGTIQPLAKIARVLRSYEKKGASRVVFHTDAGQTPLYLPSVVHSLGVDLLSLGANKLYGPHGIGALYVSNRTKLAPVVHGGKQERGLRAGTENVALAAGFAAAFEVVARERASESKRLRTLRDELLARLREALGGQARSLVVNGDLKRTLPHMLNISIPNINSEYMTLALDHAGIAVSTKSACREGEESSSHVVSALGGERWRAQNTIRFSLGRGTRRQDITRTADVLAKLISRNDVV